MIFFIQVWIQLDLQVLGHFVFRYALRCAMVIGHLLPIAFSPLSFSPEGEMQVTPDIDNLLIISN